MPTARTQRANAKLRAWRTAVWAWGRCHAATGWALALVVALLLTVGQIRALVWPTNWHFGSDLLTIAYPLAIYLLVPLGCATGLAIVRPVMDEPVSPLRLRLERLGHLLDTAVGKDPTRRRRSQGALGVALLVAAGLVIFGADVPLFGRHGSMQAMGVFLGLGVWFVPRVRVTLRRVWRWFGGEPTGGVVVTYTVGRALSMAFIGMVLSELNWWLIDAIDLPFRVYSYIAVLYLLFLVVLGARLLDTLHHAGVPAVRLFSLIVGLGLLVLWPAGTEVGREREAHAAAEEASSRWFATLERRLRDLDANEPVVVVAASGGGSRAALFASLVYEELRDGQLDPKLPRPLARQVLLISSVSGGSLASAYFAAPVVERRPRRPISLLAGMRTPLAAVQEDLVRRPFQQAMSIDFMAPLLHGVLTVGEERGTAVTRFWEREFGWSKLSDQTWGADTSAPPPPVVLFNATDATTGRRTVLGFPRLPPQLLAPYGRTMSEVEPNHVLGLAEAVRVSANFPWGFDLVRFHHEGQAVELTDGGVLDNTGLDTLAVLFERMQRAACDEQDPNHRAAASVLTGLIERGLVLVEIDAGARPGEPSLLARMLPALLGPANALARAAHVNAGMLRDRYLHTIRSSMESARGCLVREREAWSGLPIHVGFVRAGLTCENEVMTAWALSSSDIEEVVAAFDQVRPRLRDHLATIVRGVGLVHAALRDGTRDERTRDAAIRAASALADYSEQVLLDDEKRRGAAGQCVEPPANDPDRLELRARVLLASADDSALPEGYPIPPAADEPRAGNEEAQRGPVFPWGLGGGGGSASRRGDKRKRGGGVSGHGAAERYGADAGGGAAEDPTVAESEDVPAPDLSDLPPPPAAEECGRRRAWVYLGEHRDGSWARTYFDVRAVPQALVGSSLVARGTSVLRKGPPSPEGEIAANVGLLRRGRRVCVDRIERWQGTGFVWAQVRYGSTPGE